VEAEIRKPRVLPILRWHPPFDTALNTQARPIDYFSDALPEFVEDMFATMYAAKGVGLCAPQVGENMRLAVIDISGGKDPAQKLVIANPVITAQKEETVSFTEGCLSLPSFKGTFNRPAAVEVAYQDVKGVRKAIAADGLLCRALCHEIDHMNGILFVGHLSLLKRQIISSRIEKYIRRKVW
jgi:peptide deformylase